jgi:hypothetical protein
MRTGERGKRSSNPLPSTPPFIPGMGRRESLNVAGTAAVVVCLPSKRRAGLSFGSLAKPMVYVDMVEKGALKEQGEGHDLFRNFYIPEAASGTNGCMQVTPFCLYSGDGPTGRAVCCSTRVKSWWTWLRKGCLGIPDVVVPAGLGAIAPLWDALVAAFGRLGRATTAAVRISPAGGFGRPGDGNIRPFPQRIRAYRGRVILTSGRIDPWLCLLGHDRRPFGSKGIYCASRGLADMTSMRMCAPVPLWVF